MASATTVCVLCVTVVLGAVAVSAAVNEELLRAPLFDVGRLWVKASGNLLHNIKSSVLSAPDFTSPWTYLGLTITGIVLYYLYQVLCKPMNRVRNIGDLGYIPEDNFDMKEMANIVQKRRRVGDTPPVYPNGWFSVMESRMLKPAEIRNVSVLGLNLAVFRGEDGHAHVLDAYCPHLGANLAAGGRVFGNCVECPFHGWQFRGDDGKCVKIPYAEKIPSVAKVRSYQVVEANGFIHIWFHDQDIEPTWSPPVIEEIAEAQWTYRGRTEHQVNAHIEEIPENGADVAHLGQVHSPLMTSGIDLRYMYSKWWDFGKHVWSGEWQQDPNDKHIGILDLTHSITFFGYRFPFLDLKVQARQVGPGLVHLLFESPFGKGAFLQSLTPTEPLMQRMIHHVYFHWSMPTFIGKFFLLGEALMVERDIMIWNNKKYERRPVFCASKEDRLLLRHRRWYSQFYPEKEKTDLLPKESTEW